jgi:hypothetical protein
MKNLLLALVVSAISIPALAGPCVALDYQEMKDMSADDLIKGACRARDLNDGNSKQAIENLGTAGTAKPFPGAEDNRAQCNGQIERMVRILQSKGVTEKLYALCEQQAQGHAIQPVAASK